MLNTITRPLAATAGALMFGATALSGQSAAHVHPRDMAGKVVPPADERAPSAPAHAMYMQPLGKGWHGMGMAQLFPILTAGSAGTRQGMMKEAGVYVTQPAAMLNVSSAGSRVVLRTTLDFEDLTQENGELSYGGWGEGYLDARHPHTLLHEAMLSVNFWHVGGGALSLSAGKGFAPYGTDDPMGRPAVKYPTNHHLSQVLERFTTNVAYLKNGWGVEAGVFGGAEPTHAYDFSNIRSFGNSWSTRVSKRFDGDGPTAAWELTSSFARVADAHHEKTVYTNLFNGAVRHAKSYGVGDVYALLEGSRSHMPQSRGHSSFLGETQWSVGPSRRHQPYLRVEYATRPEYERQGEPGTPQFFRYAHGAHEIGATRWLISTVGYGYQSRQLPTSIRPFIEIGHNQVRTDRGSVDPQALYGARNVWSITVGTRLYFGGGAMRMGSYGMLDPMTASMRHTASTASAGAPTGHRH